MRPFIENNQVLSDMDDHYDGNYLGEETLLSLARNSGYNTASVGKVGPTAIQDALAIAPVRSSFPFSPLSFIVGKPTGDPVASSTCNPPTRTMLGID
jgi:hypothetical protein